MDIAKVISKYMKIDADNMDKLGRGGKMPSLYAHIPIVDVAANQDVVSK